MFGSSEGKSGKQRGLIPSLGGQCVCDILMDPQLLSEAPPLPAGSSAIGTTLHLPGSFALLSAEPSPTPALKHITGGCLEGDY